MIGSVATGVFGFIYFAMLNTTVPGWIFLGIVLSFIPHDLMYGPQAALIAECFTPRLRYSGASIGYQLSSVIAGGPAPLIATALFAAYRIGLCDRALYPLLRDRQHHRDGVAAGLHQPRHLARSTPENGQWPSVVARSLRCGLDRGYFRGGRIEFYLSRSRRRRLQM